MPRLGGDTGQALTPIPGSPPSLLNPPTGCPFHPRCAFTAEVGGNRCSTERPALGQGRDSACHLTAEQKQTIFIDKIQPRLR
jgi:peptide/nickel transport system ATP-binding protein